MALRITLKSKLCHFDDPPQAPPQASPLAPPQAPPQAQTISSDNMDIITRLTTLATELGYAAFIIKELEKEVLINQRKNVTITLMEKLPDIQQRGERELRELKYLLEHNKDTADVIKALEALVESTGMAIRYIEGEIGKMEKW
ncbi:hypothetical protein BGX38DRAFT_1326534 [Terfezia claveryi]|nr:hypothetical protein BGX38DRAFT_1326534 [Terfezia claveryi]